jgi:Tol biopolymer transport system component
VTRESHDAENPTATPGGEWIVYSSGDPARLGIYKIRPDGSDDRLLVPGSFILPEVSPDGRLFSYVANWTTPKSTIRVAEVASGVAVPWTAEVPTPLAPFSSGATGVAVGRSRWLPDGRSLAFVATRPDGSFAIHQQEFKPGSDTAATRRLLAGFASNAAAESFAISPDGKRIVVAGWEQLHNIMLAEPVPGIEPPRHNK